MAAAVSSLTVQSFSKVNLYLEVVNKRKDGFHNLKTLFARISLTDQINLKTRAKDNLIKIRCDNALVPLDERNVCVRSAKLLQQRFNLKQGLDIAIKKRIPVAAGLGGGSGNAAAVLLGLNRLWGLRLSRDELAKLAGKVGSDVPFFIYEEKFGQGSLRGDKILPLKELSGLKLWLVLVFPGIHASTPLIFKQWDASMGKKHGPKAGFLRKNSHLTGLTMPRHNVNILTSELKDKGSNLPPDFLFNGLEPATIKLYPEVKLARNALLKEGLKRVLMSGSGPAVFAICSGRSQAKLLSKKIQDQNRAWAVFSVSTV